MLKALDFQKPKALQRFNIPGIFWGVLFLFILFGLASDRFFTMTNMMFLTRNSAVLIIAAIGMTCAILVSQVDLSVGSVMSLAGVIAAVLIRAEFPVFLAILIAMLAGVLVGLINGVLIAVLKFDFWIVTFSTMGVCAGLALVVSDGRTVPVIGNATFAWIGGGMIGPFFFLVYLAIALVVIMQFILSKTKFGHKVYAIGGSEQSALLSGIPVVRNRIYIYMISGLFASIAGVVLAAMGNSASPIAGVPYSFEAIAAVVIGGTTFDGGKGGIVGTVLGALMLRTLASGLNLLGVAATWQQFIIGFVIVAAIVADVLGEKRRKRNDLRRRYAQ